MPPHNILYSNVLLNLKMMLMWIMRDVVFQHLFFFICIINSHINVKGILNTELTFIFIYRPAVSILYNIDISLFLF